MALVPESKHINDLLNGISWQQGFKIEVKLQHFLQPEFLDKFNIRCGIRNMPEDLADIGLPSVDDIAYFTTRGIKTPCNDLQERGFPGAIPAQDRVSPVLLKCEREVPEDPFRIESFSGSVKNDLQK